MAITVNPLIKIDISPTDASRMHHLLVSSGIKAIVDTTIDSLPSGRKSGLSSLPSVNQEFSHSPTRKRSSFFELRRENSIEYHTGIFGSVTIYKKARNCQAFTIVLQPAFLSRGFEIFLSRSYGQISGSLSVYPVIKQDDSLFELCQNGDIDGLKTTLSSRSLSPLVLDECGRTLLHVGSTQCNSHVKY